MVEWVEQLQDTLVRLHEKAEVNERNANERSMTKHKKEELEVGEMVVFTHPVSLENWTMCEKDL